MIPGSGLALDFLQDRRRQFLAQFHAPLVERVDAPDHRLDEDLVFVKGDQLAQGEGIDLVHQDGIRRPVAFECPVRGLLIPGASLHQGFRLGEGVGKESLVVVAGRVVGPQRDNEIAGNQSPALMDGLIKGVLSAGPRLTEDDGGAAGLEDGSVAADGLAVAFHLQLPEVVGQQTQPLVIGQHRQGFGAQEVDVPDADQP